MDGILSLLHNEVVPISSQVDDQAVLDIGFGRYWRWLWQVGSAELLWKR
jgi:hypothetical protein